MRSNLFHAVTCEVHRHPRARDTSRTALTELALLVIRLLCAGSWAATTLPAQDTGLSRAETAATSPEVMIHVDIDGPSRPYSRMLFGGFIEHFHRQIYGGLFAPQSPLSDEHGFRKDVIAAMKELKLSVVRWPGGCFASGYHWQDGVGKRRKPVPDPVWGTVDPNTFGTDEFVAWCRLVGCEPYICTNAGNGSIREMQQWVEYCNATEGRFAEMRRANGHPEPFHVKYWSIGNENYGSWEIGSKPPRRWGPLVHEAAQAMRSVAPDIQLAAAAWQSKRDWNLPLLAAAGSDLDFMAVHEYWLGYWRNNEMPPYPQCVRFCEGPERRISEVIEIIEEAGCRGRVKIAFDEWNLRGWHHPGFPRKAAVSPDDRDAAELIARRDINAIAAQYTMADAIFSASFLNACLRHCEDVGMANIAPIVNTRGPLYVHPGGIVKRTTFHTLAMYANELEPCVVPMSIQAAADSNRRRDVDAVATVDESASRWAIAMVNRHPTSELACSLRLGEQPVQGTLEAVILAGDSPEAYNDVQHPDRVVPQRVRLQFQAGVVRLPPHSLAIVKGVK